MLTAFASSGLLGEKLGRNNLGAIGCKGLASGARHLDLARQHRKRLDGFVIGDKHAVALHVVEIAQRLGGLKETR